MLRDGVVFGDRAVRDLLHLFLHRAAEASRRPDRPGKYP